MARITRMLTGLLTRSAWLLPEDRAEWLEGLVAETNELRQGRARVVWLLGGVWLVAGDVLRRGALRVLAFIAAAAVVLGVAWPGSLSDSAVMVNRIEIPIYLVMLALAPLLVRRYFGPVADGLLPRAVRVAGYLIVLTLITARAVEDREGEKLGAYFHVARDGPRLDGSRARELHRGDHDHHLTTYSADQLGAGDRDRHRVAHRHRALCTLRLSARGPAAGMVGIDRVGAAPHDRPYGHTPRSPSHAGEEHDASPNREPWLPSAPPQRLSCCSCRHCRLSSWAGSSCYFWRPGSRPNAPQPKTGRRPA